MSAQPESLAASTHAAGAPAAVVVCGPPASGKTTLAIALASALRYAIVDLDEVTGPLTGLALGLLGAREDAVDGATLAILRRARYDALLDVAAANVRTGIGVVLAAPFTEERTSPERWEVVVERLRLSVSWEARPALLYLDVPADVLRARLAVRGADRDRAKLMRPTAEPCHQRVVHDAVMLDGTWHVSQQVATALEGLGYRGESLASASPSWSC